MASESSSSLTHADDGVLPPGTHRIKTSSGTEVILSPAPTSDPNQPLVCDLISIQQGIIFSQR